MTLRFQRLFFILITLIIIAGALILILNNAKKNIVFFYTPSEFFESKIEINQNVRIGGFVKKDSIKKDLNTKNLIFFVVTDNKKEIVVEYKGILPDLFREGQGTVLEGKIINNNKIIAKKVFAKHDENYMPASIKNQLKNNDYWKKNYSSNEQFSQIVPKFKSENLFNNKEFLTEDKIQNKVTLINFFASWCLPCKTEHPLLMDLKKEFPDLMILGFDHKDSKNDALKFLSNNGNPYSFVGLDPDGKIGLEFGVFGLPETFLTNNQGKIIFKHTGPLSTKVIQKKLIPNL